MTRARAAIASGLFGLVLTASAPAITYPEPGPLSPVDATTLDQRFAATQDLVRAALAIARADPNRQRAETLESLVGRDLLEFDPRGHGRAVEIVGDLVTARQIAVIVPGSHTTLDTFDRNRGPGGGARALAEEIGTVDPDARVAIVAWLGYDTPQGLSYRAAADGMARTGAEALRTTVDSLAAVNDQAPIRLLCHSYGSVVCAYAAPDLPVSDLAFYGSPGVAAGTVDELDTTARVWAGRAANDWIRFVPSVRLAGFGFGTDPVSPAFGALAFPAGDGGHGDYHLRGGEALRSLARIALGEQRHPEVADG